MNSREIKILFTLTISLAFGLSMFLPGAHTNARVVREPSRSVAHLRLANSFSGPAKDDDDSLTLLPAKTILLKGRSIDFRVLIGDGQDDSRDVTRRIKDWTSSDPTVAAINDDGHLVALKIGSTIISATYKRLRATAQVTVDEVSAATFVVQPSDTTVNAVIAPAVKVVVQDNLGRVLRGLKVNLGTAALPSIPPGVLSGTLMRTTDANGVVIFDDLKLNWMGAYALQATVNTPTGPFISVSNGFNERPVNPCLASAPAEEAFCKFPTGECRDSDGDGLTDDWEAAGGIDFNGDGIVAAWEKVLTNVDGTFPDGTVNSFPSADENVKDVFVKYDWMELSDQLTNGQPTACTINPLPFPGNLFYPNHSDQCAFDQVCVTGQCRGHSDAPDPAALRMVIDAFAAHNIKLHFVKGHALPHANVISYGPPLAAGIADTAGLTFSGNHATDFYALKTASFNAQYNGQNFTEAQMFPIFHYAIFGHRHSCDSINDCAKAESINPDTNRTPFFNETGLAEQPGNDLIVSMGGYRDRIISPSLLAQGGTFMHELGHNLGLDHGGPLYIGGQPTDYNQVHLNFKPNYLSVMNYNHQTLGIGTSDPNCAPNDYVCKTTPVKVRLDYSSFAGGVVPNILDENNGTEAAGIHLGNNDIGYTWCPSLTPIPGTGPVDFNCNGNALETWCASGCDFMLGFELNHDPAGGGKVPDGTPGSGDVLQPFEDWPNLYFFFQCQSTFND